MLNLYRKIIVQMISAILGRTAIRSGRLLNLHWSCAQQCQTPAFTLRLKSTATEGPSNNNNNEAASVLAATTNLPTVVKPSFFDRFKEGLGFQGALKYKPRALLLASYRLYMCIQYQVDFDKFYAKLNAPDVMYSYCVVNFLHVWLVSVPLGAHGHTGRRVRKRLIENMWMDIEERAKQLKVTMKKEDKRNTYEHLNDVFRTMLFGLDEGLLGDDTELASAVWRHLMDERDVHDYAALGDLCDYIRKNVSHLEAISEHDLLQHGIVSFVDFEQRDLDHSKVRPKMIELIRRKQDGQD